MRVLKLFLDTNVLMDYIAQRSLFYEEAKTLTIMQVFGDVKLYASGKSYTDIFYSMKKSIDSQIIQGLFIESLSVFDICSLESDDIKAACELAWPDFEDALITVCAKKVAADYLVTRDSRLKPAGIPLCTPTQIIEMMRERGLTYTTVDLE